MSEGRYDAVGDDRLEIFRHAREGIKADGSVDVGRVDVDKIVGASARNVGKCGFRKIAVRIEESKPFPGREVLGNEVQEQRALAGIREVCTAIRPGLIFLP